MSFYDDASLIMFPSGYKEDKIYSLKPTDGSGDLTFTRASTATRVNSAGLIEKVRTNLALYSEDLTGAIYTNTNATIAANSETAPDGTLTADTITATSSSAQVQGVVTATSGIVYTMSVWLKRKTGTGQVSLRGVSNTTTPITITSDWVRYSVSLNAADTSGRYGVLLATLGDEVYAWGFQLEASDVPTDYIPTTTAAVSVGMLADVPRIDYTGGGCGKLLLEPQRTNLVTFSEQFDNAAWSKSAVTITANDITSPDGYTNADKMVESAITSGHYILQSPTLTAAAYTFTIFAKAGERNWFLFRQHTLGLNASFNLATGTLGTIQSGLTATIEDYGNDWYRCSVTFTGTAAAHSFRLYVTTADNSTSSYLGDGTSGLYLYGAGCELGSYSTSYIPTLASSVTRLADAASLSILPNSDMSFSAVLKLSKTPIATGAGDDWFRIYYPSAVSGRAYGYRALFGFADLYALSSTSSRSIGWKQESGSIAKIFKSGVLAGTSTSGSYANAFTRFDIRAEHLAAPIRIEMFYFSNEALSDAEMISLTTI